MSTRQRRSTKEALDKPNDSAKARRNSKEGLDKPKPRERKAGFAGGGGGPEKAKKPAGPPGSSLQRRHSRISKEQMRKLASWAVADKWAPPRNLKTPELNRARRMFYEIDSDGSGALDAEELGRMMRNLGQDPTDQEIRELIDSVDDEGDKDGLIQMREFFKLFALGLDTNGEAKQSDVSDIFTAFGGDPRDEDDRIDVEAVRELLLETYGLDLNVSDIFGQAASFSKQDLARVVLDDQESGAAA